MNLEQCLWANHVLVSLAQNTSLEDGNQVPNSPSSMVNQYRLEEDDEQQHDANTKDLFVTVDNPESLVTAIETFVVYSVVTKVTPGYCYSCLFITDDEM